MYVLRMQSPEGEEARGPLGVAVAASTWPPLRRATSTRDCSRLVKGLPPRKAKSSGPGHMCTSVSLCPRVSRPEPGCWAPASRSSLHSQGPPSSADAYTCGQSFFPQTPEGFPHQKHVPLCSVGAYLKGPLHLREKGKRRCGSEPLGSSLSKAPAVPLTSSLHMWEFFRLGCRIPVCSLQRSRPPLNFLLLGPDTTRESFSPPTPCLGDGMPWGWP